MSDEFFGTFGFLSGACALKRIDLVVAMTIEGRMVQLGVVVEDLDDAIRHWEGMCGAGTFVAHETRYRSTYMGKEIEVANRNALGSWGEIMVELVEPGPGPGIARDWLESRGPGMFHVGFATDDTSQRFPGRGIAAEARVSEPPYVVYLDTVAELGFYVELIPTTLVELAFSAIRERSASSDAAEA